MKKFFITFGWDAVFMIGLMLGYMARHRLGMDPTLVYTAECFFVGIMICVLGIGGIDNVELVVILIPAAYIMFAPHFGGWLNHLLNVAHDPVPKILMSVKTSDVRYACSAVCGYALFERFRPF